MKIISLHSGETAGEILYPQMAHLVDMTDAECEAVVQEINRQIAAKTGMEDYDFAIWYNVTPSGITGGKPGDRVQVPIEEFIDRFVDSVEYDE